MTRYSPTQIGAIWQRNGGSMLHVVVAIAVCLAESDGESTAHSASSDYGLWQINSSNFDSFGVNAQTVLGIDTNAKIAISMSRNGTNWAPWCTCWIDPRTNCGHGSLASPQPGSPAYLRLPDAYGALPFISQGSLNPANFQTSPVPNAHLAVSAWGEVQNFVGPYARARYATLTRARQLIRTLW